MEKEFTGDCAVLALEAFGLVGEEALAYGLGCASGIDWLHEMPLGRCPNQRACPRPNKRLNIWGAALLRYRREHGWSQDELARRVQIAGWDVSRVVLFRIESGERLLTDYEAIFLLRVLGRKLSDLDGTNK